MLADISNINDSFDLYYILTAVAVVDLIVIAIARNTNYLGKQVNIWYDTFGMTAVLLDIFIIIIGFIISKYIVSLLGYVIDPVTFAFNPLYFIVLLLVVQLAHDMLLYKYVIQPTPYGVNKIIDIYKNYAVENGKNILIADAAMMLGSGLLAMYLKNSDLSISNTLLVSSLYLIPYFVYQNKKY